MNEYDSNSFNKLDGKWKLSTFGAQITRELCGDR